MQQLVKLCFLSCVGQLVIEKQTISLCPAPSLKWKRRFTYGAQKYASEAVQHESNILPIQILWLIIL